MLSSPASDTNLPVFVGSDRAVIGDHEFQLGEVERVAYWSSRRHSYTGAYQETTFWGSLAVGSTTATFSIAGGRADQHLALARHRWEAIVAVLRTHVTMPLVRRSIAAIDAGGSVDVGGVGSCRIDRLGLRLRRPFARTVPWRAVDGWTIRHGSLRLEVRAAPRAEPRQRWSLGLDEWNVVAVPDLLDHYLTLGRWS